MTPKKKDLIWSFILIIVGFSIIVHEGGWILAAGIFIAMWGSNVQNTAGEP